MTQAQERTEITDLSFGVTGITCASCVRRIEKALVRVPGVERASVHFATERASVSFDPHAADFAQLRQAVEHAGYAIRGEAALPQGAGVGKASNTPDPSDIAREAELGDTRRKWSVSLVAGAMMMALMYLPFELDMQVVAPLLLIPAAVVQVWASGTSTRPRGLLRATAART